MGILGAALSLGGGLISAFGSKSAAKTQADAADRAAQVQWDMYNQSRQDMGPYRSVGTNALYRMADHYGLPYNVQGTATAPTTAAYPAQSRSAPARTGSSFIDNFAGNSNLAVLGSVLGGTPFSSSAIRAARPQAQTGAGTQSVAVPGWQSAGGPGVSQNAMQSFYTSPDYQFRRDEGIKGIENSMLARGRGLSGATGKALAEYSGDLASGEWNNYMNRIASLAGLGQTSAMNLASLGQSAGSGIGNAYMAAGQARGSGTSGAASGLNQMLGNLYYTQSGGNPWSNWGNQLNTQSGGPPGPNWA